MQNYTEQILVRLKKGQNEILKQEASKYHLPVSSYVRLLLFKEEKEIIKAINWQCCDSTFYVEWMFRGCSYLFRKIQAI